MNVRSREERVGLVHASTLSEEDRVAVVSVAAVVAREPATLVVLTLPETGGGWMYLSPVGARALAALLEVAAAAVDSGKLPR